MSTRVLAPFCNGMEKVSAIFGVTTSCIGEDLALNPFFNNSRFSNEHLKYFYSVLQPTAYFYDAEE